jgi:hypothetical protein
MDRALARIVAISALRSSAELNNLVPLLQQHCASDEYVAWRDAIADVSLAVSQRVLTKVFAEHPDIEVELDDHYTRFGRPA